MLNEFGYEGIVSLQNVETKWLFLTLLGFLFRIVFCLFLIIFVWREHEKTKSSFDIEKGYEDFERVCVCRGGGGGG